MQRKRCPALIATTVNLVLWGLGLASIIPLPSVQVFLPLVEREREIQLPGQSFVVILLVGIIWTTSEQMARLLLSAEKAPPSLARTMPLWGLPSLFTIAGATLANTQSWWGHRLFLIGATGIGLGGILTLQQRSLLGKTSPWGQLTLHSLTYASALVLFTALQSQRGLGVLPHLATLVAGTGLALELFREPPAESEHLWRYAGTIGLLLGELAWALNYLELDPRIRGGFLLLAFYILAGITSQSLQRSLNRRTVIEFAGILLLGLLLLLFVALGGGANSPL
ncbi:MAG: hypothetical protein J7M05_09190 [Anaerolineae bacterium]|nr:hypothetical protein [Anaerolineae bacterium]